ncbi:hypothetical protein niasHS_012331 [Heterodera schachtii]|uniref:Uncharacterized protein n=1 Tax=Heterodera schachtii TaxID=97005 RepID=A0ABD2IMM8_HETSC
MLSAVALLIVRPAQPGLPRAAPVDAALGRDTQSAHARPPPAFAPYSLGHKGPPRPSAEAEAFICLYKQMGKASSRECLSKDNQKWAGQIVFHRTQQNHPPFINTKNRLQATRTQQLLPTISEEFYEVIDEETAAEPRPNVLSPPHFDHKTSAPFQRPPKMAN